jgi:hypothetical protein
MPNPEKISKQEIIENLSLLRTIVSRKVELNSYDFGLCPFHKELTPSFSIYSGLDRARYHCFGCGATGDIFNYVQRISNLNFKEAHERIILLIKSSGLIISPFSAEGRAHDPQREEQINSSDTNYCFTKCENYLSFKIDYELLLEENHSLRESLNLPDFQPENEKTEPNLNFKSNTSHNKLQLS